MRENLSRLLAEIVDNYKVRIKETGLNKRQFCRAAGIHENTLYHLKNPRISTLQKIEEALQKLGV